MISLAQSFIRSPRGNSSGTIITAHLLQKFRCFPVNPVILLRIEFDNDAALVPVADNTISTDTTGFTIETNGTGGTPVTDDNGMPLYYLTERTLPSQDGEPVAQQIAYPVMMDEGGYFVRMRTLEDGAQFSTVSRIDLERTITAYVYADGSAVTLDEDGNAVWLFFEAAVQALGNHS